MKKSSFVALILGTVSGVLFALGMCMALLPQWNAFVPGIALGCAGIVVALVGVFVWRKMERKPPVKITGRTVLIILVSVIGALAFGVGMCFTMVWNNMVLGIVLGLLGILILLSLIPIVKGLKTD